MIDKLWRKKYEFVVDKNGQVVVKLDDGTYDIIWVWKDKPLQDFVVFSENGIKSIEDYCYFYDLIAQADKAERLQKAVDFAIDYLEQVATHAKAEEDNFAAQVIKRKIDEIKQLIKVE